MKRKGTWKPIILTSMLLIGVILSTNQSQAASKYPYTPDPSASTTLRNPFNETACTSPAAGMIRLDSYSVTCYYDGDQDGYGSATTLISADDDCFDLNESPVDTDCDDDDPMIHPDATEVIGDGVDQDCNGSDAILCYADNDRDGFGSTSTVYSADADCAGAQVLEHFRAPPMAIASRLTSP